MTSLEGHVSRRSFVNQAKHPIARAALAWLVGGAVAACGGKENSQPTPLVWPASGGSAARASTGGAPGTLSGGASALPVTGGSTSMGGSSAQLTTHSTGGTSNNSHTGGATTQSTGGTSSYAHTGGATAYSSGGASGGTSSYAHTGGATTVGGSAGSSSAGAAAVQTFTTSFVTPYCARLAACCTLAGYAAPTAAACKENELGYYETSLSDGSASVNAAAVSALLAAVQDTCDQPSYALYGLTSGVRPIGSDCTDVGQCQGDSVACLIPGSATLGKCVTLTRGKVGDPCAVGCDNTGNCRWTMNGASPNETAACWDEDGLRCDSVSGTCAALTGLGEPCDSFTCGVHADCRDGVCVSRGKLGENCADGRSCESTLLCNYSTYVCEKMSIAWSGGCGG